MGKTTSDWIDASIDLFFRMYSLNNRCEIIITGNIAILEILFMEANGDSVLYPGEVSLIKGSLEKMESST